MKEGKEQSINKGKQSIQVFKDILSRIENIDITTAVAWFMGLTIIFIMRDLALFEIASFQKVCIVLFWTVILLLMLIMVNQTMIYHRIKEIGGIKR
ncbi:hypothetical protein KAW18_01555 [candidate division WOR-3 bacterium]|nr:hypothetical protein [candidate division WOR-3 bacterium]